VRRRAFHAELGKVHSIQNSQPLNSLRRSNGTCIRFAEQREEAPRNLSRHFIDLCAGHVNVPALNIEFQGPLIHQQRQRLVQAEQSAKRALLLDSRNAPAHLLLGYLLAVAPATRKEGIRHLDYAAQTMPDAVNTLRRLAAQ